MQKFYITTAIDYANAKPHIGHALEKIQADVIARYRRIKGDNVWFVTGTDEHGAKIARAADAAGKNTQDFVDEHAEQFRALKHTLNLSWDDFIRTSDQKRHVAGAQKLWMKLHEAGDLYKKKYRGLYCVGHEAFVTEKDLVGGKCRDHQKEPEVIEEENYFFRLSKYGSQIKKVIEMDELKIFPRGRKHEMLSLIESGLEDVSFSRPRKDLSWGIPVPNDPEHTMYVWCDALASYITAIGYDGSSEFQDLSFRKWWPADLHVIGKDILRFHAAIWPAMLLSAGLKLPKSIFVHGMITVEGEKMSKTVGNVIDPAELVKKYGTDAVRYFLLREISTTNDGDFSYEKLEEIYNGDLANGIGNLVARVAALGEKVSPIKFGKDEKDSDTSRLIKYLDKTASEYHNFMNEFYLNLAIREIWYLMSGVNAYINIEHPWNLGTDDELKKIIGPAAYVIYELSRLLLPFLPETAEKIREQISFKDSVLKIKKGGNLFPRLI